MCRLLGILICCIAVALVRLHDDDNSNSNHYRDHADTIVMGLDNHDNGDKRCDNDKGAYGCNINLKL